MEVSADSDVSSSRPDGHGEDSQEAEWAAMQLTVVRDCTPQATRQGAAAVVEDSSDSEASDASGENCEPGLRPKPEKPNALADSPTSEATGTTAANPRGLVVVHRSAVVDDSSDSEGSSEEAEKPQADPGVSGDDVVGDFLDLFQCDASGNPKGDAAAVTEIASLLGASALADGALEAGKPDVSGGDLGAPAAEAGVAAEQLSNADLALPSVEEAQSHLDSIRSRRNMLQALSAKYTAPGQTKQAGPQQSAAELSAEEVSAMLCTAKAEGERQPPTPAFDAKPKRVFGPPARPQVEQASQVMDQLRTCLGKFSKDSATTSTADRMPAAVGGDSSSSFTIGGSVRKKDGSAATVPNAQKQPRSKKPSGAGIAPTWTILNLDSKKLKAGKEQEAKRSEELWHQFLAGDDMPVGSDALPTPEQYFA